VGVLQTIAQSPCGLAELCERTELPRATAYRLAAALEVHRLLARDDMILFLSQRKEPPLPLIRHAGSVSFSYDIL